MCCSLGLAHCVAEGVDPVDMSIGLTELIPLFGSEPLVSELRILINVVIKSYKSISLNEHVHFVGIDEVGILS